MLLLGWRRLFFWMQVRYIWDIGCSVFILIVVLICCYFSGVVWWVLVAAVAEYRYFGELFFLEMSWLFFSIYDWSFLRNLTYHTFIARSHHPRSRTRAKRTSPLLVQDGWVTAGIFSDCLVRISADFSSMYVLFLLCMSTTAIFDYCGS
jgi:hypothetical protein